MTLREWDIRGIGTPFEWGDLALVMATRLSCFPGLRLPSLSDWRQYRSG